MSVSESNNRQLQENLLPLLKPVLAVLSKDNQANTSEAIWPNKLLVRTALKLGKVD